MTPRLDAVWVVRDARGVVVAVAADESYGRGRMKDGDTIERLPLLTPEMAAVVEAAEAWASCTDGSYAAEGALCAAVRALRAARGDT